MQSIKSILVFGVLLPVFAAFATDASAITIPTVPVGNLGNANDSLTGSLYGGVGYAYNIGTTEVTVGQYTAFLNAVAATDTYALYNTSMATDLNIAGISRSGAAGSHTYSVIGSANHPVAYVSWGDAARFSNWLQNGQPIGLQNASTTEGGAYTLNGAISIAALNAVTRNSGATWFIPSESEWYKAAYYNPGNNTYNQYPTSSNAAPTSAPPGSTPNTANFISNSGAFAVTGSRSYSTSQNYLTNVGAYTASASPYGTFDQGGNVWEWNEAFLISESSRGLRGGSFGSNSLTLLSSARNYGFPSDGIFSVGFRVASIPGGFVPEPSTGVLAVIAGGMLWWWRKRFK